MKNNKLISLFLVVLVCLSLVVSASAAENDLTFALEPSGSTAVVSDAAVVKPGETFTVNVDIAKNPGFLAAIIDVKFDAEVLEFISATEAADGVVVKNAIVGKLNIVIGDALKAATSPEKAQKVELNGSIVTLTFKVLATEDKTTKIDFFADPNSIVDVKGDFGMVAATNALNVNVIGANHTHTEVVDAGTAATCTEAGLTEGKHCSACGEVLVAQEPIEAKGHDFSGEGVMTTEPGCETMGVRTYTCANGCGETQVDDKVPAVGHAFGDWTVTKAATVEAEGEETRTCANCNAAEKRSIAKLPAPATQPTTQPTEPTPAPAKGVSTWVIVAIVVVVLAGAGVAAFFVLKNKKK